MKKTIFAIVALVAIVSSILTVLGMNVLNAHRDDIVNFNEDVIYTVTAKSEYERINRSMDNTAYDHNTTGVLSVTTNVGGDEIVYSACYINGERVSSEDYNEWIYSITDEYANVLDEAQNTVEEQENRLNNITLADWFNCKFGG